MACYKARGFLQKAESLGLTAWCLGQTMLGLGTCHTFKAGRSGPAFLCTGTLHSVHILPAH